MTGFSLNNRRLDYLSGPTNVEDSVFQSSNAQSKLSLQDANDFYLSAFTSTPTYGTATKTAEVKAERIVPPPRKSSYTAETGSEGETSSRREVRKGPQLLDVRPLEIRKRKDASTKIPYHGASQTPTDAQNAKPCPSPQPRYHLSEPVSPSPASRKPARPLAPGPEDVRIDWHALAVSGSDEEYITDRDSIEGNEGVLVTPPGVVAHSVGSRFLSLSNSEHNSEHGMLSPPKGLLHSHSSPIVPTIRRPSHSSTAHSFHSRASTARSSSDFHLGLGKFYPYDERAAPGPSPPLSPSPTRRTFLLDNRTGQITEVRVGKRGTSSTPSSSEKVEEGEEEPMTPSKAGSKAMQMLGSSKPVEKGSRGMLNRVTGGRKKKNEHFRPLPSSVLKDIDLIFGKTVSSSKVSPSRPSTHATRNRSTGANARGGLGDRKVGEGKTVEVVDENGRVWHDLEEQQEFSWLLSEQGRGGDRYKVVSPVVISSSITEGSGSEGTRTPSRLMDEHVVVISAEEAGRLSRNHTHAATGDDDPFGMSSFTNVLSLPKPNKAPFVIGSTAQHGSSPLAFLAKDPYARTLAAAAAPLDQKEDVNLVPSPEKRRPAPLTLASGPPPNTKHVIAVQAESGSTLGYGPPPLLRLKNRLASTSSVPLTPYVTPRTAPLPPAEIAKKGRAAAPIKGSSSHFNARAQHQRTASSASVHPTVRQQEQVEPPPMRKGQSFFDVEISPDATQQTFSMSGAKRKASGALHTMLRRVNT